MVAEHAGRKASTDLGWKPDRYIAPDAPNGWQTFAPSAEPLTAGGTIPKELSRNEIKAIVRQFAQAAKRAVDIGFNLVELHGFHSANSAPVGQKWVMILILIRS